MGPRDTFVCVLRGAILEQNCVLSRKIQRRGRNQWCRREAGGAGEKAEDEKGRGRRLGCLGQEKDFSSVVTEEGTWSLVRRRRVRKLSSFLMKWDARHLLQGRSRGQGKGAAGKRGKC